MHAGVEGVNDVARRAIAAEPIYLWFTISPNGPGSVQ